MKVSSMYLSHEWGVWGRAKGLDFELFYKQVGNEGAAGGIHGHTMDLFIHGVAMGSPISPLIPILFMEELKVKPFALPHTPIYGKGM